MQLDIVHVATSLAQQTKVLSSVAIIGALSDMIRHLRKSIHCSLHDSTLGNEMIQYNLKFETAVEQCLVKLSQKVGDAGPILDIMAVMLESMSNITVMARTIVSAVFRTAQIIAAIPNLSYENKAFQMHCFITCFKQWSVRTMNQGWELTVYSLLFWSHLLFVQIQFLRPLQPLRRRSLFTLATSMIIFSARAFNIPPLVNSAKTHCKKKRRNYTKSTYHDNMKFLEKLSDKDLLAIKEQLVSDFIPIDGCPVGTQLTESLGQAYRSDKKKNNKPRELAKTQLLIPENDAMRVLQKSSLVLTHNLMAKTAFLLSIDDLLHTVSQTTTQLGRYLVSDPLDMTYTEMAGHCEALLMGKQEKMSFMSSAKRNKFSYQTKETSALPCGGGNPFVDQQGNSWEMMGLGGAPPASNMCVAEYQTHPAFFNPPAFTPFDNFFKPLSFSNDIGEISSQKALSTCI
ncbi:unnamed protein product [Brassica napus]|uniref:(rape) hypothetical protein n=1 Tax=Brassica napus TaxID=3708 RepID=A0A816HZJ6_BRANA|nr:unnamed protein product [Brassica napus]